MAGSRTWLLTALYWVFAAYLFIPIAVMVAMSFKDSRFIGFPIENWTLNWYLVVVRDAEMMGAFGYSVLIAVAATVLSLAIGLLTALMLGPVRFWGKSALFAVMALPAVIPGVISGISLRLFIRVLDLEPGTAAIILGHTVHNVPFVTIMLLTRLNAMPVSLVEAAKDLGADEVVTFFRVTLPFLMPAVFGACMFSLLISFDDFIRSFFLGGYEPTLPVLIFSMLRSGMSPEINAISTAVLVVTAGLGLYAERYTRRLRSRS
jgi:spermidine/putrescine transport system permease protein